mmetsp:Transcript_22823/g.57244  ORF Transcript_22823/g.57244 Transcript_22823/m.57244 type:complete len:342 (-) Transcript_22823:76-1101(-)
MPRLRPTRCQRRVGERRAPAMRRSSDGSQQGGRIDTGRVFQVVPRAAPHPHLSLDLHGLPRQALHYRQRRRLGRFEVQRLDVGPLFGDLLRGRAHHRQDVLHRLLRRKRRPRHLDVEARPAAVEHVRGAQRLLHLRGPVLGGQVHWDRLLLLLEERLAQVLGQRRQDAVVGEEEVVLVAQRALRLVRLILGLQFGQPDHLGHARLLLLRQALLRGLLALAVPVLHNQAHLRVLVFPQGVRQIQPHRFVLPVDRRRRAERDDEVHQLVLLIQQPRGRVLLLARELGQRLDRFRHLRHVQRAPLAARLAAAHPVRFYTATRQPSRRQSAVAGQTSGRCGLRWD